MQKQYHAYPFLSYELQRLPLVTCALGVNFANIFLESPTPICLFTIKLWWLYDEGKSTLDAKIMHGLELKTYQFLLVRDIA